MLLPQASWEHQVLTWRGGTTVLLEVSSAECCAKEQFPQQAQTPEWPFWLKKSIKYSHFTIRLQKAMPCLWFCWMEDACHLKSFWNLFQKFCKNLCVFSYCAPFWCLGFPDPWNIMRFNSHDLVLTPYVLHDNWTNFQHIPCGGFLINRTVFKWIWARWLLCSDCNC